MDFRMASDAEDPQFYVIGTPASITSESDAIVERRNKLLQLALAFISEGLPVLPLHCVEDDQCSCGSKDCPYPGLHPIMGHEWGRGDTDFQTIMEWWQDYPKANIGVAMGNSSDFAIIVPNTDGPNLQKAIEAFVGTPPDRWHSDSDYPAICIFRHPCSWVRLKGDENYGIDDVVQLKDAVVLTDPARPWSESGQRNGHSRPKEQLTWNSSKCDAMCAGDVHFFDADWVLVEKPIEGDLVWVHRDRVEMRDKPLDPS